MYSTSERERRVILHLPYCPARLWLVNEVRPGYIAGHGRLDDGCAASREGASPALSRRKSNRGHGAVRTYGCSAIVSTVATPRRRQTAPRPRRLTPLHGHMPGMHSRRASTPDMPSRIGRGRHKTHARRAKIWVAVVPVANTFWTPQKIHP